MTRAHLIPLLALVSAPFVVAGRPARAEDAPVAAKPAGVDAAIGTWSGAPGTKSGELVVDGVALRVERAAGGYRATTRVDLTQQPKSGAQRTLLVVAAYAGEPKDGALHFRSTERLQSEEGAAPVILQPATLVVRPKGAGVHARLGNDAEGYADFDLARTTSGGQAEAGPDVRGEWGGDTAQQDLGSDVRLDEMYVTVSGAGAYAADVRMECTVHRGGKKIPVTIDASYRDGALRGGDVHFALVPWHRTVPSEGKKDDIAGNPLVLRMVEGRLNLTFGGSDGFSVTLPRKAGSTLSPPKSAGFDDFAGSSWGGNFDDAKLSDTIRVRECVVDLERKAGGVWAATVHMLFVVKTPDGDALVKADGSYPPGRVEGDAIKFPGTRLTRTIVSTGAQNDMEGNPLEIRREPDGRAELKFVGEGGFTLTAVRR